VITPAQPESTPTLQISTPTLELPTQAPSATLLPSKTIEATPQPTQTPTALPARLPAKNWKEWPIVPEMTRRAREIYRLGIGRNDSHAFSKVGDCQGIKEVWLGVYDLPGAYKPGAESAALQETIAWFAGSFNRNGFAVMGGYNARAVLQPMFADPAFCQAGENPIECEYRQQHPSIVLVSLEFYYDGRNPENYETYLRRTLDFFIARGVVPVLATKADNMEGDDSLNLTTAKLALEYDLPLWNFWRAVQPLPNHGMDSSRPDGFHISVDAWQVRSSTALQALDAVWRGVRDLLPSSGLTSPGKPTPTPLARATPAPTAVNSTQVILSLAERNAPGQLRHQGVFLLDTELQTLSQILVAGYQLQGVSPDGRRMLVNQGHDLYLADIDGSKLKKLASDFYPYGQIGAAWLPDGQSLVLIAERGEPPSGSTARVGRGIWQVTVDGGAWQRLTPSEYLPHELGGSPSADEILWADGGCPLDAQGSPILAECVTRNWYRSDTSGAAPFSLTQMSRLRRSPDGKNLAYTYLNEKNKPVLALTASGQSQIWTPLPEGYLLDYTWSPDGLWLAVLWQERSDYSGKITAQKLYLLNPTETRRNEIAMAVNYSGQVRWAPDGRWLLVTGTEVNSEGYRFNLRLVPITGGTPMLLDGKISPNVPNFVYVTNLAWVPQK
jgi:Tol biopolymer transport system component